MLGVSLKWDKCQLHLKDSSSLALLASESQSIAEDLNVAHCVANSYSNYKSPKGRRFWNLHFFVDYFCLKWSVKSDVILLLFN